MFEFKKLKTSNYDKQKTNKEKSKTINKQ